MVKRFSQSDHKLCLTTKMRGMETSWPFYYRTYADKTTIQFKPCHDKTNHFSIVWPQNKHAISNDDFQAMDHQLRAYLVQRRGKVTFTIVKACANCTYGRFEKELEDLLLGFRAKYAGINTVKDLPLNDPNHQHLKTQVTWDEAHPLVFHIHSRSADANFTAVMTSDLGTKVVLDFSEFA